jgi:hypothetical protein
MDGKIIVWDLATHAFKKEFIGHAKGVYTLDWSEQNV